MPAATLQLDDLHTLLDSPATRHILDARDFGLLNGELDACVRLYQLIPVQQHALPWIVRIELHDENDETIRTFDNHREAEAEFERAAAHLNLLYPDYDDYDDED